MRFWKRDPDEDPALREPDPGKGMLAGILEFLTSLWPF
jgi:hypothetical protein